MVMNRREKILILTGSFGEGHQQAAKAIQEAAKLKYQNVETSVVDFMAWAYPNLFPISHFVYIKGVKTFPQLYGFIYQKTYQPTYFSKKLNRMFSLGLKKMLKLLHDEKPTVVVSTYPFSSSIFSKLKESGLTNVPLVTVITDHTHHSYWLHPCTDQYIVGSQETKQELIRLGIPAKRIASTGIPIRTKFLRKSNRTELIHKYQLEAKLPTVLIMGGGEGLIGKEFLTNSTLEKIPYPIQLIVLCGNNNRLRLHLEKSLHHSKHHVVIKGYTDNVEELMAVSDMIVTKPGGVTTSEAIAMELPMLLIKALPGQEEDNARYLIEEGIAIEASQPSELAAKLVEMLENQEMLKQMKKRAENLQTKKAAFSVLDIIQSKLLKNFIFIEDQLSIQKFKKLRYIAYTILFSLFQ
ncbi:MAG: glycosyltransferase [Bacillota bacterium]|jgi:processive 1,2-diacylglycerol beta-glucosyltransferase|nr:glycosyltransferase [Bacillota bacterium]MDP4154558.1 glycosyltransferase [Bacillota bacterium]